MTPGRARRVTSASIGVTVALVIFLFFLFVLRLGCLWGAHYAGEANASQKDRLDNELKLMDILFTIA